MDDISADHAPPTSGARAGLPPGSRLPAAVQTAWFLRNPLSYVTAMRPSFGDLMTVRSLRGTVVIGCSPAHAKQLFTADPDTFQPFAPDSIRAVLGNDSTLVTWGDAHRRQRKLLQPPFHGARMRAYSRTMLAVAREHAASLRPGQVVKMYDVTTSISLDVILRTVFGVEGAGLTEGREMLRDFLGELSPVALVLFSAHLPLSWFGPWQRMLRQRALYDAMIERLVTGRRARGDHGEDILGMLLDTTWDDGSALSTSEIGDQLLTLVVAGHETTAIALAWSLHGLYQQPATLARLREELASLGPDPAPEALVALPFLGGVCDESMRQRPIVTDILRTLRRPFEFGGHLLPAGIGVGVVVDAIHADPSIYPEPEKFLPERFLDRRFSPFEFLPFGGGNRRCLGAAFADQETRLVIATLASALDLEPLRVDRRVRRNVTMGPKHGVPVRVVARR